MHLADSLLLAYLPTTAHSSTEQGTERIHTVDFLPISGPQLAEIQHETAAEPVLQLFFAVIFCGCFFLQELIFED